MENPGAWIWAAILSPFIGSFIGVVVMRAEEPQTMVLGRSRCDSCGHPLAARDLVPVLSWMGSRGRCLYCGEKIGIFPLGIELAALGVALWSASLFSGALLWVSCGFGWSLLALAAIDYRYFLLPDFLTLPLTAAGLAIGYIFDGAAIVDHFIGAASGFLFVVILRALYQRLRGREGMGFGDAKFLAASGAWITWMGLPSVILIAALTGLGAALIAASRKASLSLSDRVPFGTFLALGTWIVWLYGPLVYG